MDDPSFKYRCQNLSTVLSSIGITSTLQHIDSYRTTLDTTHVVFHRPKNSSRLKKILKQLKIQDSVAIADFDDLIFDTDYVEFSPAILNKIQPYKRILKAYDSHFEALTYFENISVSTAPLVRHIRLLFPLANIHLLHNTTHFDWLTPPLKKSIHNQKIITYFPGTRSHDRDLWQIEDVVTFFLKENPSAKLMVIGPVQSSLFSKKNKQIQHFRKLPFADYKFAVANSWANLLPLEATPFNQCKSALKVIEAATYCTPTICSPLPDAVRFDDIGAMIALDEHQWIEHLALLSEPDTYSHISNNIKENFNKVSNPLIMAHSFRDHHYN